MCGKLKTIKVEVRTGSGTKTYTYQSTHLPKSGDNDNIESTERFFDSFEQQRILERIFRGSMSLCAMQRDINRNLWKMVFDDVEQENEMD